MRSEQEMMERILAVAREDDRVLAAYLKGSRANPAAPKDRYQDFDVMYVVTETAGFLSDTTWLNQFGSIMLRQEQDDDFGYGDRFGTRGRSQESYSWLLIFDDGNRIDIGVETTACLQSGRNRNKLFVPLLDKAGCLPPLPPPSDVDFHVKPPEEKRFYGCCNEFFWSLCDVLKGIARDELPFAMTTYHSLTRSMLEQMLAWYVGCRTDFSLSCGKLNKYLKRYLPEDTYAAYTQIYSDGDYAHFQEGISAACKLFRKTALLVAAHLDYRYPQEIEDGFYRYQDILRHL